MRKGTNPDVGALARTIAAGYNRDGCEAQRGRSVRQHRPSSALERPASRRAGRSTIIDYGYREREHRWGSPKRGAYGRSLKDIGPPVGRRCD